MKKQDESAKKIYTMLAFQYKPLEKLLLSNCSKEAKEKYLLMSYSKKITTLDQLAQKLDL